MFFEITPAGKLTRLADSNTLVGSSYGGLIQASNGNFYGTGYGGRGYGVGNLFELTPAGKLTLLHGFTGGADGSWPYAGLVQATDGNLYGTTSSGGANTYYGTAFKITLGGTLTTLHSFDGTNGAGPEAGLVQATNGELYGTAGGGIFYCGQPGCGTVFSLSVGLGPFVETVPTSGKVGSAVTILGNNLTGATSVTFNSIAASFTVSKSGTSITTTVPSGATTGLVKVTTASGKILTSNVKFRVP